MQLFQKIKPLRELVRKRGFERGGQQSFRAAPFRSIPGLADFLGRLRERFFPAGCAHCGGILLDAEEIRTGLCGGCARLFAVPEDPRCRYCRRPLVSEQEICTDCRALETHALDGAFSVFSYAGRCRDLLQNWKFGKNLPLGAFFASKIAGLYRFFGLEPETPWVPVPPRPGKIRRGGWDQVAFLAKCLAREGRRIVPCLKRLPSQTQKTLNREERLANLRGRIVCKKTPPRQAIIFDDVITTGSTLDACACALREAGTEEVYGITLFYD
jgi:ComF family protein